jgi:hypothetical protein
MINEAVEYIRKEIRDFVNLVDGDLYPGHIHVLKENNQAHGVYISLVNIEKENTLANIAHYIRENGVTHYKEPPVFLNLYMLLAFNFQDYGTSLLRLSKTIELFQNKPVFSSENQRATNPFPKVLKKIIFDIYNLDFEQLNHLWGVLGCSYFPSVLYKVRLVKVQHDDSLQGPEITTIEVETFLK